MAAQQPAYSLCFSMFLGFCGKVTKMPRRAFLRAAAFLGYDCVFSTSTLAMALGALGGTCTSIPLAVCENFSGLW